MDESATPKPQGKALALDLGDVWVGVAISDALRMLARPLTTVKIDDLIPFLTTLFSQEKITTVVVGNPITMQGKASQQTEKIVALKQQLAELFSTKQWLLWDERLSSKRAASLQRELGSKRDSDRKIKEHAQAACFILDSFLISQREY